MKTTRMKRIIPLLGFCAMLGSAHAAEQMQTITINVPVEINWPQGDVGQAFLGGPPLLKCNLYDVYGGDLKWLSAAKVLASASQPLMIDASGHYSGNVAVSFSVPAGKHFANNAGGGTYWCFLGTRDAKLADLAAVAQQRGLKVDVDNSSTAATFKTK